MVSSFYILCFSVLLLNVNKSYEKETTTLKLQEQNTTSLSFGNLCPYNKFCQTSPLKKILNQHLEPCCKICSCESDCYEIGNCCPDEPRLGKIPTKFPCQHLSNFGKNTEGIKYSSDDSYWHHVIDECPKKRSADSYSKCYNPKELQDYMIVSSTKTGKLYRNKHCAECNGIKEYVNLKLRVWCEDIITMTNLKNVVERDLFVLENCSLMSFPPERSFGISHCVPKSNIIRKCNSTGKWDFLDKEIEKGCMSTRRSDSMVYRVRLGILMRYSYFANVYCFLCNKAKSTEKFDTCDIEENNTGMKSGKVALFGLIDDAKLWEAEMITGDTVCDSTHIWDPFKKLCRRLFCPRGHIPEYGSCKGLFNLYGYTLDVHFEVLMKGMTITTDSDSFLLRLLERRFIYELGNDLECGKCTASLYSGNNSNNTRSQVFFRYITFANEKCPHDMLLKRIRQIALKKEIYLHFNNRNQAATRIALNVIFEGAKELLYENRILAETMYTICKNVNTINMSILQYCPSIILSMDEMYDLKLTNVSTSLSKPSNDSQSAIQQVCVDSYFAARQAKSSAVEAVCFTVFNLKSIIIVTLSLKYFMQF